MTAKPGSRLPLRPPPSELPLIAYAAGILAGFAMCYIAFFVPLNWWQGILVGLTLVLPYIIADIVHSKRVGYF